MKQKIFKISIMVSLVGIFLLLFLTETTSPLLLNINNLEDSLVDQKIKIQGQIIIIKNRDSFKILTIKDETGKIDVICSCKEIENYQEVVVTGTLKKYQEQFQIQADKIVKI